MKPGHLVSLGHDLDETDAQAVLAILGATSATADHRRAGSTHIARQAIWSLWELPRLPKPIIGGKYPRSYPWSAVARDLVLSGDRPSGGWGLVLEHVTPRNLLIAELWTLASRIDTEDLKNYLWRNLTATVVSKAEDALLVASGVDRSFPEGSDPDDLWSRYKHAGLDIEGFAPLDDQQAS